MRAPDYVIGENYMQRWYVIPRNRWFNVYLHRFTGPDEGRHLHDHPWWSLTLVLWGRYVEQRRGHYIRRDVHFLALRRPTDAHRIDIVSKPTWTLFITGPVVRDWGFWVDGEWVHFEKYQ